MRTHRVRHRGLDGISVTDDDDNATRMRCPETIERADDAALHIGETLTIWKTKTTGEFLHGLPFRQLHQVLQKTAGPVAEVAFEQTLVDADLQAASLADGCCSLSGALEGAGINRIDAIEFGDSGRHCFSLFSTRIGQVQPRSATGKAGTRGRCLPMANQQDQRGTWWLFGGFRCSHNSLTNLLSSVVDSLAGLRDDIENCRACPRLVAWREDIAVTKRAAYRDDQYWGRPVSGFGDPQARIIVLGLAPAAHGANRTGRVFTGDRSGDWLFRAMFRAGLANQPETVSRDDGLALTNAWVTAAVRCAPPGNKPLPSERDACRPFWDRELALLANARVVVCLGGFAYQVACKQFDVAKPPKFGHGVTAAAGVMTLLCSFHPSQQNTFTGRLTEPMLDAVFSTAVALVG